MAPLSYSIAIAPRWRVLWGQVLPPCRWSKRQLGCAKDRPYMIQFLSFWQQKVRSYEHRVELTECMLFAAFCSCTGYVLRETCQYWAKSISQTSLRVQDVSPQDLQQKASTLSYQCYILIGVLFFVLLFKIEDLFWSIPVNPLQKK